MTKQFKVIIKETTYYSNTIKANSLDDAYNKAHEIENNNVNFTDWEMVDYSTESDVTKL